jgi:hypothetical protein
VPREERGAEKQIGVSVPPPISGRVDALVTVARSAGERTSRKELVSALINGASDLGVDLSDAVRRLRLATLEQTLVPDQDPSLITAPQRRPGPRTHRPVPSGSQDPSMVHFTMPAEVVEADRRLDTYDTVQMGLSVAPFVDEELDAQVRRLRRAGTAATRSEVVAALIFVAPESGEKLGHLLRQLRIRSERQRARQPKTTR